MTFDYQKLAEKYKRDPAEVQKKIEAYAANIKTELKELLPPDRIDTEVEKIVSNNLGSLFRLTGLEYAKEQNEKGVLSKANVIVLGVSPAEDRNSYAKYQAKQKYYELLNSKKDYDIEQVEAIKAGKLVGPVRIERYPDGYEKLIPVYTDKTKKSKDANGNNIEVENPDYLKDIPTVWKLNVPLIIAGLDGQAKEEFLMGSMTWDKDCKHDIDIGKKSTVYGRQNNGYFSISKDAYEGNELYQKAYDVAMRVLPSTDYWMSLVEVDGAPVVDPGTGKNIYTKFATKGSVQKIEIQDLKDRNNNPYHKVSIRLGDVDLTSGIKLSTTNECVVAYVSENIQSNDEVIVFGCKKSFVKKNDKGEALKDESGKDVKIGYYELWGVVKQFDQEHDAVLAALRAKGLIQ